MTDLPPHGTPRRYDAERIEQALALHGHDVQAVERLGYPLHDIHAAVDRINTANSETDNIDDGGHREWRVTRDHGTHAGYNRHRWRGEEPCRDCFLGERAYQQERHQRRRQQQKAAA